MTFLELKHVKKSFQLGKEKIPVLKDINIEFKRGEFVSILGESGGGKTSLLNIIGGLDSKFEGDVLLNGKSIKASSAKKLDHYRSNTVGFIFQSFNLISHLTVLQNVLIPLEMSNMSKSKKMERAKYLLDQVGLNDHITKYPNQLSGGQKQRVAIARALANDPDIIIADEPTGALDTENTKEILQILENISLQGKLVIAVTHSGTVADYGTRVIQLVDGYIQSDKQTRQEFFINDPKKHGKISHLKFKNTFFMALRHMKYHFGRNLLIILGTMIGIFSVILMLGLGNGVTGYINHEMNRQINPTAIQVTKLPTEEAQSTSDSSSLELSEGDLTSFKKINHVKNVESGAFNSGTKLVYQKKNITLQLFQTWNNSQKVSDIKYGHKPGTNEILLAKRDALKLDSNYQNLIGKNISIYISSIDLNTQKPVQFRSPLKISGITSGPTSGTNYETLETIYNTNHVELIPNFATISVNKTQNVKSVQNDLKNIKVTQSDGTKTPKYVITGVGSIINSLTTYLNMAFYLLAGIAGISLIVSAIMIIVVLYISVSERTKEIGILRALGARRKDIRRLFMSEAFLIGLFSSVLAVGLASLIQIVANKVTMQTIKMPIINITHRNMIFGIVISIIIALLSALAPSRKAAKLDPRDTLADE